MKLRQLLMLMDMENVYKIIHDREVEIRSSNIPTLEIIRKNYSPVVKELLDKPKVKSYPMPLAVARAVDILDPQIKYVEVYLLNPKYQEPQAGLQPYGGRKNSKIPDGYYNINLSKYNKKYSLMGTPWSKIIDTEVKIQDNDISSEEAVANILWELTFDGWTEKQVKKSTDKLKKHLEKRLKQVKKEIKSGQAITVEAKTKGAKNVVIPNSVLKDLKKIFKGKKKGNKDES
jgi:hypothetical protein